MSELSGILSLLGIEPRSSPLIVVLLAMLVGNYFGVWWWGRHVKLVEDRAERLLALTEVMANVMESAGLKVPPTQSSRAKHMGRDSQDE